MMTEQAIDFPLELAHKYNRPGPRYTSYPTAPRFHEGYASADFEADLRAESGSDEILSLYVHLPFCRSLCTYCGCHMLVTHRPERISRYVEYVMREIDLVAELLGSRRRAVQVHWGGGTPTYLAPSEIELLMDHLQRRFDVLPHAEVSIEADPRGLTREHLEAAHRSGFNRISFGVQDLDPEVQLAIGRVQPPPLVEEVTRMAREVGFDGISYDLIYGLPHQTPARFARTLDQVIALGPDRLSIFSYAHVPWMKRHQRLIDEKALPSTADKLRILVETSSRLVEGGYDFIGMDHFARPEDTLAVALREGTMQRNFQGYSTHAGSSLIGFGTSAISQLDGAYAQNHKDLRAYYEAIDERSSAVFRGYRLSDDDRLRRAVIMDVMCRFRLRPAEIEAKFGIDFDTYFADARQELAEAAEDGLLTIGSEAFEVTPTGRFFVRNIAMPFDRYLNEPADAAPKYSKTI